MQRGLWPLDRLMVAYLLAISLLTAAVQQRLAHAAALLALHAVAIAVLVLYARYPGLPAGRVFRHWYPILYIGLSYRVVALLVPALWPAPLDGRLAAWDYALWGVQPTVWLERLLWPPLTEALAVAYALFAPSVVLPAALLWARREWKAFRSYSFLLTLGFLVSYAGYLAVPARGPRIYLAPWESKPLSGVFLYEPLTRLLDQIESVHYDCFPSGHVEMTILAWWACRRLMPRLAPAYAAYGVCTLAATVYLRYHYTVDLFAGIGVAALVLAAAPRLESVLGGQPADDDSGGG